MRSASSNASSWSCVTRIVVTASRVLDLLQAPAELRADLHVERAERLVEQEHRRARTRAPARAPRAAAGRPRAGSRSGRRDPPSPTSVEQLVAPAAPAPLRAPCGSSGRTRCSRRRSCGGRSSSSGRRSRSPARLRRQARDVAALEDRRFPESSGTSPAIRRRMVLLPLPLEPSSTKSSPFWTSSDTPSTIGDAAVPLARLSRTIDIRLLPVARAWT